jgi:protein-S-isoprenylcysteine O-methyltransferase
MNLVRALQIVGPLWGAAELAMGIMLRGHRRSVTGRDRGSLLLLWAAIGVGNAAGVLLHRVRGPWIPSSPTPILGIGLGLLLAGLALRLTAILTLRRFFTTRVTIHHEHELIRHGVYRRVRHPSYTGLLMAFLGMGLAFVAYGCWLSFFALLAPVLAALGYRISVEERAMREAFGAAYVEYCRRTNRLVPWVG